MQTWAKGSEFQAAASLFQHRGPKKAGEKCQPGEVTPLGQGPKILHLEAVLGEASRTSLGTMAPLGSLVTQTAEFLVVVLNHGSVFFQGSLRHLAKPRLS